MSEQADQHCYRETVAKGADGGGWGMSIAPLDPAAGVRFEDLPEQAWPRQEIIDGSLHVTPDAGLHHQVIVGRLSNELARVAPDDLEVLPGANILRRGDTDRLLVPDVVVLEASIALRGGASAAPEAVYLAVEVISPFTRVMDMYLKRQVYAEWGVGTYWVLDPITRSVNDYGVRDTASSWLSGVDTGSIWAG
jgi:Uma2 family endonuclease